ncbi:hypothetical protein V866_005403 [Kwoniella sp. B9012]
MVDKDNPPAFIFNNHCRSFGHSRTDQCQIESDTVTNPSCSFRHEDENGNSIPPALTAAKAALKPKLAHILVPAATADSEDIDGNGDFEVVMSHKGLMDAHYKSSGMRGVIFDD